MRSVFLYIAMGLFLGPASVWAEDFSDRLMEGDTRQTTTLNQIVNQVQPGAVVVISELHTSQDHHARQQELLRAISMQAERFSSINVGMEFFYYPDQARVDEYLGDSLSELDFLAAIEWGGYPFAWYRNQVRFPLQHNGTTLALNAPKWLTRAIARRGLADLNAEERNALPPNFVVGNANYRARFLELMGGGHVPPDQLEKYFAAQSTWDDTMAWQASNFLDTHRDAVLVIVVGDFHAKYGGGLPDRLRARGISQVITISQVNLLGLSSTEIREELDPHPLWGVRADYIWTSMEAMPEAEPFRVRFLRNFN